jgi:FkbM family methyltransferase
MSLSPGTSWRQQAKDRLELLRNLVVRRLGGTIPERGLSYEQLVHLFYPSIPDALREQVDAASAGDLSEVSTIRRMLGSIEHQLAPTPFTVQINRDEVVPCSVGEVELLCDPADGALTPGLLSGRYEPHLTAVFERYCQPGMTVIDVGASLGYYSLLASHLVGGSGHVFAIEPNSEDCRLLLASLRYQGVTNVELLPVAVDEARGWACYTSHIGANGGLTDPDDLLASPGTVVPTFRLDDLVGGPVGLLKMDVEGAEGRVVGGATRLLEHNRPVVTTELSEEMLHRVSDTSLEDYLGYFENLGYSVCVLDRTTCEPRPYPKVRAVLDEWNDRLQIEDILLLPDH